MREQKIFTSFVLVGIFFLLGFVLINQPDKNLAAENIRQVKIAGQTIKVDLALTKEEQAQGLSGRTHFGGKNGGGNVGMLFVFEQPGLYPFWMKDMWFPIDIIWIEEGLKVVYIEKNASPSSYPKTFVSEENSKYVLEVPSGFSEENNLKVGDKVEFIY